MALSLPLICCVTLGKLLDVAEPQYWLLQAQGIMLLVSFPDPLRGVLPCCTSHSAGFASTGRYLGLSLEDYLWILEPLASPLFTEVPGTL